MRWTSPCRPFATGPRNGAEALGTPEGAKSVAWKRRVSVALGAISPNSDASAARTRRMRVPRRGGAARPEDEFAEVDHGSRRTAIGDGAGDAARRMWNPTDGDQRQDLDDRPRVDRVRLCVELDHDEQHASGTRFHALPAYARSWKLETLLRRSAGDAVQLVDGEPRLVQRLHRLLRRLGQLPQRFADLLGAGRLGLDAVVDLLEARRERLDLLDGSPTIGHRPAARLCMRADLLGKFVHPHDAGGDRRSGSP